MYDTLKDRVERGAEVLDRYDPGWWRTIQLPTLEMGSCIDCVLGQLFGDYQKGLSILAPDIESPYFTSDDDLAIWSNYRGFMMRSEFDLGTYEHLNKAWTDFILKRREADSIAHHEEVDNLVTEWKTEESRELTPA